MSDTDRMMDCAEYVLGTLTADERAELDRDMQTDAGLRTEVRLWEDWLAGLNDVIPEVAPESDLWPGLARRLRPEPERAAPPVAATLATPGAVAPTADLTARFRRSRARWRASAITFAAIAAGLALFIGVNRLQPAAPSYLAVVNRGGDLPALIVRVDTATDIVTIRSVAAETPADRVLELWYIAAGQAPRSIGLLDRQETRAALPAVARSGDIAGATLAVSVEPKGGSPTGAPTGQVVYSGKLILDQ